jgi:hypothetical protein
VGGVARPSDTPPGLTDEAVVDNEAREVLEGDVDIEASLCSGDIVEGAVEESMWVRPS